MKASEDELTNPGGIKNMLLTLRAIADRHQIKYNFGFNALANDFHRQFGLT